MKAFTSLFDKDREDRIERMVNEAEEDKESKACPNCKTRGEKRSRKCTACGVFYAQFARENPGEIDNQPTDTQWSTKAHYEHIPDLNPADHHKIKVLDPTMDNPNSKYNILFPFKSDFHAKFH